MKDKDLADYIEADTGITALIGDRIWTTWLPEKTLLPAITCNYLSDTPQNTFEGEASVEREIITINLWCDDKVTLATLYALVKARLNGYATRLNKVDLSDEEQGIYRYALDYSIWG